MSKKLKIFRPAIGCVHPSRMVVGVINANHMVFFVILTA